MICVFEFKNVLGVMWCTLQKDGFELIEGGNHIHSAVLIKEKKAQYVKRQRKGNVYKQRTAGNGCNEMRRK
jgi:hypothetical protein